MLGLEVVADLGLIAVFSAPSPDQARLDLRTILGMPDGAERNERLRRIVTAAEVDGWPCGWWEASA